MGITTAFCTNELPWKYADQHSLDNCSINVDIFVDLMKILQCPASLNHVLSSFEEVRQLSIQPPTVNKTKIPTKVFSFSDGQTKLQHPKL